MKLTDLTEQKFSFTIAQLEQLWNEINHVSFDDGLVKPLLLIEDDLDHIVPLAYLNAAKKDDPNATVMGYVDQDIDNQQLVILIADKIASPKELVEIFAHEMVHQALAEEYGYDKMVRLGHGPEFEKYSQAIKKYHGTELLGKEY